MDLCRLLYIQWFSFYLQVCLTQLLSCLMHYTWLNAVSHMPSAATHTHTRLTAFFPGIPRWAGTRKVKPIWILLKQETVSCSGISWTICKSAPRSRQITTPAPHRSVFYRPDALPATQPTTSKHWRQPQQPRVVKIKVYLCSAVIKKVTVCCNFCAANKCAFRCCLNCW